MGAKPGGTRGGVPLGHCQRQRVAVAHVEKTRKFVQHVDSRGIASVGGGEGGPWYRWCRRRTSPRRRRPPARLIWGVRAKKQKPRLGAGASRRSRGIGLKETTANHRRLRGGRLRQDCDGRGERASTGREVRFRYPVRVARAVPAIKGFFQKKISDFIRLKAKKKADPVPGRGGRGWALGRGGATTFGGKGATSRVEEELFAGHERGRVIEAFGLHYSPTAWRVWTGRWRGARP